MALYIYMFVGQRLNVPRQPVWNALVLQLRTVFAILRAGPSPNIGDYNPLLLKAVEKQMNRPPGLRLPEAALDLIREFAGYFTTSTLAPASWWSDFISSSAYQPYLLTAKDNQVERCCLMAGLIHLRALSLVGSLTELNRDPEIQKYVLSLKDEITNYDEAFWYKCGPEVFRWVLITGAAAGNSISQRGWFVARMCPFCTVMVPEEVDEFLTGADHIVQLFNQM